MSSAPSKFMLGDVGKPATWSSSFMFSSVSLRDMAAAANQAGPVAGGQGASTRIKARLYQDLSTCLGAEGSHPVLIGCDLSAELAG